LNLNMVNFLITSIFSITTLGYYALTQRIIGIPSKVIGNSFSQVYYQKATEEYNKIGNTKRAFKNTLKKLIIIALPIFFVLYFIAEPIFGFVYGEEWVIAGTYAKILVPLAFARFVSSSLSVTVAVFQKQQFSLLINILLLTSTLSIFILCEHFNILFETTLNIYTIILSIEYLLFLTLYYKLSLNK